MIIRAGLAFGIAFVALQIAAAQRVSPVETGILKALNQLRAEPSSYVALLIERRPYYQGKLLRIPGKPDLITQEGVRPLDEAIAALRSIPAPPGRVVLSAGLSHAAADHVVDSGPRGLTGHRSSDGSDFTARIARYGTWSGEIGEEISYGPDEAREVILELLIDDGVANRGHRKSLLDARWKYAGIACGPHARYGTMCVIDFASGYQDR
jgi:hypothetical protein